MSDGRYIKCDYPLCGALALLPSSDEYLVLVIQRRTVYEFFTSKGWLWIVGSHNEITLCPPHANEVEELARTGKPLPPARKPVILSEG